MKNKKRLTLKISLWLTLFVCIVGFSICMFNNNKNVVKADESAITSITVASGYPLNRTDCMDVSFVINGGITLDSSFQPFWNDHETDNSAINNGVDIMKYIYVNGNSARDLIKDNDTNSIYSASTHDYWVLKVASNLFRPVVVHNDGGNIRLYISNQYATYESVIITFKAGFTLKTSDGTYLVLASDKTFTTNASGTFGEYTETTPDSVEMTSVSYTLSENTEHSYITFTPVSSGSIVPNSNIKSYWNDHQDKANKYNYLVDIMDYIYINDVSARDLTRMNVAGKTSYQATSGAAFPLSLGGIYAPVSVELLETGVISVRVLDAFAARPTFTVTLKAGLAYLNDAGLMVTLDEDINFGFNSSNVFSRECTLSFESTEGTVDPITVLNGNSVTLPDVPEKSGYSGVWQIDESDVYSPLTYNYDADKTAVAVYTISTDITITDITCSIITPATEATQNTYLKFSFTADGSIVPISALQGIWNDHPERADSNKNIDIMDYIYINGTSIRALSNANKAGTTDYQATFGGSWPLTLGGCYAPVSLQFLASGSIEMRVYYEYATNPLNVTFKSGFAFVNEDGISVKLDKDITFGYASDNVFSQGNILSFEGISDTVFVVNGKAIGTLPELPDSKLGYWTIDGEKITSSTVYSYDENKTASQVLYTQVDLSNSLKALVFETAEVDSEGYRLQFRSSKEFVFLSAFISNPYWNDHESNAQFNGGCDIMTCIEVGDSTVGFKSARELSNDNIQSKTYEKGTQFPFSVGYAFTPVTVETGKIVEEGETVYFINVFVSKEYTSKPVIKFTSDFMLFGENDVVYTFSADTTYKFGADNAYGRVSTLSFDDGVSETIEVVDGNKIGTLPTISEKTGYTSAWKIGDDVITADTVYNYNADKQAVATYTAIEYTITYHNVDDAENPNPTTYTVETDTITLADAIKDHYAFGGWYKDEELTEKITEIVKGTTGNLDLYADFSITQYTITYHNVDGLVNKNPTKYTEVTETIILVDVEKSNAVFMGWYSDAEFTNSITEIVKGSTGDLDIYAKFMNNCDLISNVTFVLSEGTDFTKIQFTFTSSSSVIPADGFKPYWNDNGVANAEINNGIDLMEYIYINGKSARELSNANKNGETSYQSSEEEFGPSFPLTWGGCFAPVSFELLTDDGRVQLRILDDYAEKGTISITFKKGFAFLNNEGMMVAFNEDTTFAFGNDGVFGREYTLSFTGTESAVDSIKVVEGNSIGTLPDVPAIASHTGAWQIDDVTLTADTVYEYSSNKTAIAFYTGSVYNIVGYNMTIGSDLSMNVYVTLNGTDIAPDMYFYVDGRIFVIDEGGELYKDTTYRYRFNGLSARNIDTEFRAQVIVDGIRYNYSIYSMREYLVYLSKNNPSDELKTLIADIISYGQELDKVANDKSESDIQNISGCTASTYEAPTSTDLTITSEAGRVSTDKFISAILYYTNANKLIVKFSVSSSTNFFVSIDNVKTEHSKTSTENTYLVETSNIYATDFDHVYTFKLYVDNALVQTLTYSVKSYVYTLGKSSSTQKALVQRLYCYGKSVEAYVGHHVDGTLHDITVEECETPFIQDESTEYAIYIDQSGDSTTNESISTSANYLVEQIYNATGVTLNISTKKPDNYSTSSYAIIYGFQDSLFTQAGLTMPTEDLEATGYYIKTVGNNVFIEAYGTDGYRLAGLAFLRYVIGYDMISEDCVVYDRIPSTMPSMDITEKADFEYRQNQNVYTDDEAYGMGMLEHTDIWIDVENWDMHNTLLYLPLDDYYDSYPEWYVSGTGADGVTRWDICYTAHGNSTKRTTMVNTVAEKVKYYLDQNPTKNNITFSQMDSVGSETCCTCSACKTYINTYGTYSALMINFLNEVSAKVKSLYEATGTTREFNLLFLAYRYSADAPVTTDASGNYKALIECADNVYPWLAQIDEEYVYSLYDDNNSEYAERIKAWSVVSDKIYMWLYGTNFTNYFYPYSTWKSQVETYRYLKNYNVEYVWTEAQENDGAPITAFSKLKDYLDSKFMFNVNSNYQAVVDNYFDNYYLEAGESMKNMFNAIQNRYVSLLEAGNDISSIYCSINKTTYWTKTFMEELLSYVDNAYSAIEKYKTTDNELYQKLYNRINRESLFPRFVLCTLYENYYSSSTLLEMRQQFKTDCDSLEITVYKESGGYLETLYEEWGIA